MRRIVLVPVGLFAGALLSVASARAEMPSPDHTLAERTWPTLTAEQKALVEIVARDAYRASPRRGPQAFETLPAEDRKALRGEALRTLGLTPERANRRWV